MWICVLLPDIGSSFYTTFAVGGILDSDATDFTVSTPLIWTYEAIDLTFTSNRSDWK